MNSQNVNSHNASNQVPSLAEVPVLRVTGGDFVVPGELRISVLDGDLAGAARDGGPGHDREALHLPPRPPFK